MNEISLAYHKKGNIGLFSLTEKSLANFKIVSRLAWAYIAWYSIEELVEHSMMIK